MKDEEKGTVDPPKEAPRLLGSTNNRNRCVLLGALVVAALALVVGLSVGLTRDRRNSIAALSTGGPSDTTSQAGNITDPDATATEVLQNATTLDSPDVNTETAFYKATSGSLNVTLKLFSPGVTRGYTTDDELKIDLAEAAKFLVVNVIKSNNQEPGFEYLFGGRGGGVEVLEESFAADAGGNAEAQTAKGTSAAGETDFMTNNQEGGVDESDVVKSDGTYVYASYGDVLVVWDVVSGEMITNITMPVINYTCPDNVFFDYGNAATVDVVDGGSGKVAADSSFVYCWQPKAQIQSLLLSKSRLVVIVNGYGEANRAALNSQRVIYELLETQVQIYDTSTLAESGELKLIKQTDVNGYFRDARMIDSNVHIVTVSTIDSYSSIVDPIAKWQDNFRTLSNKDYEIAAAKLAGEELIPSFLDRLVEEMSINGKIDLAQVSLWQSQLSNNSNMEQLVYGDGAINSLTQVVSFDVSDDSGSDLQLSLAGAFMPSSWGYTYATDDMLIVTAQGWNWNSNLGGSSQTTYLLGLRLDGASATPHAVGSLDGYLLNQYSVDIVDGHLRVANTIQSFWPFFSDVVVDDANGTVTPDIVEFPSPQFLAQNYITVLEIPVASADQPTELKVVGQTKSLGKDGEVFTSVRFFDKVAYGVTFLRTDPFYVVNLTDPKNPEAVGSLEVTGFSAYIHSINSDNTLLLALGQEADESTGFTLGLQLTLFDANDPANPKSLQRHTVETDPNTYSFSTVEWDFKAFRYLSLGNDFGLAIVPLSINAGWEVTDGNFDGFVIFDVSKEGISERFRISHVESQDFWGCYYNAYLPERSLVFNGDVMTLKGHSIVSTNLDSGLNVWNLTLGKPENTTECVYW